MNDSDNLWCAMCGKYTDHQSGSCPELREPMPAYLLCPRHPNPIGYTEWHAMSERLAAKGQKQTKCQTCGLYQWPCEADMCPNFKAKTT